MGGASADTLRSAQGRDRSHPRSKPAPSPQPGLFAGLSVRSRLGRRLQAGLGRVGCSRLVGTPSGQELPRAPGHREAECGETGAASAGPGGGLDKKRHPVCTAFASDRRGAGQHMLAIRGLLLGLPSPAARNPVCGCRRASAPRRGWTGHLHLFQVLPSGSQALGTWCLGWVFPEDVLLDDSSLKTEGLAQSQKEGVQDASRPRLAPPRGAPQPRGWT